MAKDTINIYWSPHPSYNITDGEWNMLYPNPKTLFSELKEVRVTDRENQNTFFICPATNAKFKRTFVFRSGMAGKYEYDFTDDNKIIVPLTEEYIGYRVARSPITEVGPLIEFYYSWNFFSEEPLDAVFTPPTFHQPKYFKYASCVPGEFDIGQWYRPYNLEVQAWGKKGKIEIEYNEPLFYAEFRTNKKINFIRYRNTPELAAIAEHNSRSASYWGKGLGLRERYNRFKASSMREIILKEIKKNIVE